MDVNLKLQLDRIEQYAALSAKSIYDVSECSMFTGYRRSHIYSLTHTKRIPHYKREGKIFFKRSELEAWMTANKVVSEDEAQAKAIAYALDKDIAKA